MGRLGKGFLIRHIDRVMIHNREFKNYIRDIADNNNASYQDFQSPGGTDAGAAHTTNNGVLSTTIGIAARNIHTASSVMDMRDYDSAKNVVMAMIKDITNEKIKEIIHG